MIHNLYLYEWMMHTIYFFVGAPLSLHFGMRSEKSAALLAAASYFLGVTVVFIFAYVAFLLQLKLHIVLPCAAGASLGFYLYNLKKYTLPCYSILFRFAVICQLIFITIILLKINIMSFDSYRYVFLAKQLSLGTLDSGWLLSYSLTMPLLQAVTIASFDVDVFNTMMPVSTAVFLVYALTFFLHHLDLKNLSVVVAIVLVMLAFTTSYFFMFGAFYLMPNMMSGLYLALAISFINLFEADDAVSSLWLYMFFGMLVMFSLMRVEGFVFSLLLLPLFFSRWVATGCLKSNLVPYYCYLLIVAIWFVYLGIVFPQAAGPFYSRDKLLILLGLVFILCAITLASKWNVIRVLLIRSSGILTVLLVGCLVVSSLVFDDRIKTNLAVFLKNVEWAGYWGKSWFWAVAPFIAICMMQTRAFGRNRYLSDLLLYVASFLALLFLIFFLREQPLRVGFGDSANRMLLHVYPTVMLLIALGVGHWLKAVMSHDLGNRSSS